MNDKTGSYRDPRHAAALAVVAAAALLATACGGSSGPPSTTAAREGPVTVAQELALAQCMRSHRVPSFPDPSASGGFSLSASTIDSRQVQAAYGACRHLLAAGGPSIAQLRQEARQAQHRQQKALPALVKFSRCMRSRGVPDFPDPPVSGQRTTAPPEGGGINPTSPRFRAAVSACQHLLPAGAHLSIAKHASV
jgi:hypothetical protein